MDTPAYDHVNVSNSSAAVAWGAVLAIAVEGLRVHANSCSGQRCDHSEGGFPPPLLVSGMRPDLFLMKDVSISDNTGWQSSQAGPQQDPPGPDLPNSMRSQEPKYLFCISFEGGKGQGVALSNL